MIDIILYVFAAIGFVVIGSIICMAISEVFGDHPTLDPEQFSFENQAQMIAQSMSKFPSLYARANAINSTDGLTADQRQLARFHAIRQWHGPAQAVADEAYADRWEARRLEASKKPFGQAVNVIKAPNDGQDNEEGAR